MKSRGKGRARAREQAREAQGPGNPERAKKQEKRGGGKEGRGHDVRL